MAALALPVNLQWHQIPFRQENADGIVEEPGVYAFAIGHSQAGLPPHGYVLYIGEVGGKSGPTRTLRARFKDYLREKTRAKRPQVAYFLNTWETCLVFHFATLDPESVDLFDVERRLNDAMIPPYSRGDFSPEIRQMKKLAENLVPVDAGDEQ
ncbi:MAG: hypothetical protein AB7P22_00810 [Vicinamibacterales bacterium]